MNSSSYSGRSCDRFTRAKLLRDHATGFPFLSFVLVLVVLFTGLSVDFSRDESCDEDTVGGSAALELEDPLDRPGTTMGTSVSVLHGIFLPFLMRCFLTS